MTDNDNLELKKRSRRRLVGAAALALLAAIVLPMVMDQEPESPAQDIHITIPDREADSALARPIAGRTASPPPETEVAPPPQEQPPGAQGEAPPPPSVTIVEPAPQVSPQPGSPSGQAAATAPKPEVPKAASDKPAAQAGADEAARVKALLEGRTTVASAPSSEAFVVQVGAFGDAAKASSLSARLKGKGFAAYTEKAGTVTRVRVGPFANREEAGKVAERLRADGVQGVVTTR